MCVCDIFVFFPMLCVSARTWIWNLFLESWNCETSANRGRRCILPCWYQITLHKRLKLNGWSSKPRLFDISEKGLILNNHGQGYNSLLSLWSTGLICSQHGSQCNPYSLYMPSKCDLWFCRHEKYVSQTPLCHLSVAKNVLFWRRCFSVLMAYDLTFTGAINLWPPVPSGKLT